MSYPTVLTEDETIDAVLAGKSLARIGDGEIKLARGSSIKAQQFNKEIQGYMRKVCRGSDGPCLTAIPRVASSPRMPPERDGYKNFCLQPAHVAFYNPERIYGSQLVTRPDCAPHIDCPEFWAKIIAIWAGCDVVLVRGSGKSLLPENLGAAASVEEIKAEPVEAWADAEGYFQRLKREQRRVLLCVGATGTALAWRLAHEGVHAIDLGGIGRFMRASVHDPLGVRA